jgi:type IV pilus assembly protein PilA
MIPQANSIRMMDSMRCTYRRTARPQGISLIELLLALTLAMVFAAAAIPRLLNSRIAANEGAAVASVDVITYAQESYRTAYPTVGYAGALSNLALTCKRDCAPNAEHACLIDCNLPSATITARDGYLFALSADSATPHRAYLVAAVAGVPGHTGNHDFCSVEDGKIRNRAARGAAPSAITREDCQAMPLMP